MNKLLKIIIGIVIYFAPVVYCIGETDLIILRPDLTRIQSIIEYLDNEIGIRPAGSPEANRAAQFISEQLKKMNYHPVYQNYRLPDNRIAQNIMAYYAGKSPREIVLLTHYDSPTLSENDGDTANQIALILELMRIIRYYSVPYGIHFVFLGAEEQIHGHSAENYFSAGKYLAYQKRLGLNHLDGIIRLDRMNSDNKILIIAPQKDAANISSRLINIGKTLNIPLENKIGFTNDLTPIFIENELLEIRLAWMGNNSDISEYTFSLILQFLLTAH